MAGPKGMVDVAGKPVVERVAVACGRIKLGEETVRAIREGRIAKGDVETATTVAALNAVKETPRLLPYCHPLPLESVKVKFDYGADWVEVCVEVKTHWKTGVEMEALTGACIALLNIWDMVKALEKDERGQYPGTRIEWVKVESKIKRSESS